jgi:hypothetical protein
MYDPDDPTREHLRIVITRQNRSDGSPAIVLNVVCLVVIEVRRRFRFHTSCIDRWHNSCDGWSYGPKGPVCSLQHSFLWWQCPLQFTQRFVSQCAQFTRCLSLRFASCCFVCTQLTPQSPLMAVGLWVSGKILPTRKCSGGLCPVNTLIFHQLPYLQRRVLVRWHPLN